MPKNEKSMSMWTATALAALMLLLSTFCLLPTSASALLTDGLVGWWTFNDPDITANAILDRSGQGNNGGFIGGSTSSAKTIGKLGQALHFDGVNTRARFDAVSDDVQTGAASVAFWFKLDRDFNVGSPATQVLVSLSDTSSVNDLRFYLVFDGPTPGALLWETGTNFPALDPLYSGITSWKAGNWYHLVGTISANGLSKKMYVNGVIEAQDAPANARGAAIASEVHVAELDDGSKRFAGAIDDLRFYNRELTAQEIKQLYNFGRSLPKPPNNLGLVGYWPFNEGTGTLAGDFSGNRNDGTFAGGSANPTWTQGRIGKALRFDGDDYLPTADINATDGVSRLTISMWIKADDLANDYTLSDKGGAWATYFSGSCGFDDLGFQVAAGALGCTNAALHKAGVWEHWVAVYDGTLSGDANILKMYLNGAPQTLTFPSTGFPSSLSSNSSKVTFGDDSDLAGSNFPGVMDEVRIYNRALSADEVARLYGSGLAKIASSADLGRGTSLASGLVGHWTFDGGDITTNAVLDRSGQGNNGGYISVGSLSTTSAKTIGKLGQALNFASSTSAVAYNYIEADGEASSIATGDITYTAWIKMPATYNSNSNPMTLMRLGDGPSSNDVDLSLGQANGNGGPVKTGALTLMSVCAGQPNAHANATPATWQANTWYFVAGTLKASDCTNTLYINGALDFQVTPGAETRTEGTHATHFAIGGGDPTNNGTNLGPFNGTIDDARVYNRVLTAQEIKQLYLLGQVTIKQ